MLLKTDKHSRWFCVGVWNHEKEIITIETSYDKYMMIVRKLQVL